MGADGFHAIRVLLEASSPIDVDVEWTLRIQPENQLPGGQRGTFAIAALSGRRWQSIEFPAIQASEGRTFSLDLRLLTPAPAQGGQGVVALAASKDRPLGHSIVRVDARERWGDLVFETRAEADTALGRFRMKALPMLPAPLRHMALVWLAWSGSTCCWSPPRRRSGRAHQPIRSFDGPMARWLDGSMAMVRWPRSGVAVAVLVLCACGEGRTRPHQLIDGIDSAVLNRRWVSAMVSTFSAWRLARVAPRDLRAYRQPHPVASRAGRGRLGTAVGIHPVGLVRRRRRRVSHYRERRIRRARDLSCGT